MEKVMTRWWLVLTLLVVSADARAESTLGAAQPIAATHDAETAVGAAEHQVLQLTVQRAALKQRYEDEVADIDRLKKQRASWRRDRELRDSLSSSLETSNELDAATR